jgi:exosortase
MQTLPLSKDVIRDRRWQIAIGVSLVAVLFGFSLVLWELLQLWTSKVDYSHGLLIVPFIGYLLWRWRDRFPTHLLWPNYWGLPFILLGAGLSVFANKVNFAREWMQAAGLMMALMGVVVIFCGGFKGLIWAAPALIFLPMAFELPFRVETLVSNRLQAVATKSGNIVFQTLGLPSYTEGNTIIIEQTQLGVEKACSGLSMLLAFLAFSLAVVVLAETRPWIDRAFVLAAAIPIAIFCNIVRVVVTGLVYYWGWKELGDKIVHDLAGWLMMPLGLFLSWLILRIMDWLTETEVRVNAGEALGLPKRPVIGQKS